MYFSCSITLISIDEFNDCVVIACLRKLQKWSITSILSEFTILSGTKDINAYFDYWQFIENFNIDTVVTQEILPDYMKSYVHYHENDNLQIDNNSVDYKLISEGIIYDPILSLIADQEEDD
mmetsp:Transcript_21569/g.19637  ORF Transcript_21569/g.19637 Transcript_21569/m.19637 type:complete len:121 (+) Transcript_21569:441-803(+)